MPGRGTKTVAFWGVRAIVVAAALAVALAVPVLPALQAVVGSEGWARAAEPLLFIFFFRAALVLLAIREGRFGFLGISLDDAAPVTSEGAARAVEDRLLVRIGRISDETDAAADRIGILEDKVRIVEETLFGEG
jgi:hypothetical protein